MNVKTLLKGSAVTAEDTMPIRDARALMLKYAVPCLPVLRQSRLVGMITELHLRAAGPSSVRELRRYDWSDAAAGLTVREVMSRDPVAVTPDASVAEVARLMRRKAVDAVPVVDGEDVVGVVTRRDLLAVLGGLLEHRHPTALGHVLAATSLGPSAERTFGEALRVAAVTGAALTLLHVLPRISRLQGPERPTPDQMSWREQARRRIAEEALEAMCRARHAQQISYEVADGPVAHDIARRAAELDSDLIVVGTASRRGCLGFSGRNTADRLTGLAPCPVLVIPRGSEDER